MIPEEFEECDAVFVGDQPEYNRFPVFKYRADPTGRVALCWKLSWRERLRVLFTGRVWQLVLTFNQPLQPQFLSAEKSVVMPLDEEVPDA